MRYTRPLEYFSVGAEVYAGKNVFGDDFSRVGAFIRFDETAGTVARSSIRY